MTSRRGVIEVAGPVLIPPPVAPWAFVDVPAGGTITSWGDTRGARAGPRDLPLKMCSWTWIGKRKGWFGLDSTFFMYFVSETIFHVSYLSSLSLEMAAYHSEAFFGFVVIGQFDRCFIWRLCSVFFSCFPLIGSGLQWCNFELEQRGVCQLNWRALSSLAE